MDSDLLTAALALAERGWLPGVKIGFVGEDPEVFNDLPASQLRQTEINT